MRMPALLRFAVITGLVLSTVRLAANNIQVTNVSLTDQNTTSHFTMVEFDISWENSWRLAGGPANWDAAWVFVKFRVGGGPWQHAFLNDDGHLAPAGSTIENGLVDPGGQYNPPSNPVVGVFIYRSAVGTGTFSLSNVRLRWNYGDNDVDDDAQVDIKVFAIEHVFVSGGSYYLGSGGNEDGHFYAYTPAQDPYHVMSNGVIPVGTNPGDLYYDNPNGTSGDQLGPIPAAFPKGYNDFYLMKYEVSQQAYVDFLNTLDREQQVFCVNSPIAGGGPYQPFVMSAFNVPLVRNGIRIGNNAPEPPSPVTFFCDLNANELPGDGGDGGTIPCNFLKWGHLSAFLDWAGLRPITELEFEKAARGPGMPVPNEFPWGNVYVNGTTSIPNPGTAFETADSLANCSWGASGPLRCGCFARPGTSRQAAGAGYYGALNLSDNVRETTITAGHPDGRAFTGIHGDGLLSSMGTHNVTGWPDPVTAFGSGLRGGYYLSAEQTSDRLWASDPNAGGSSAFGGRGGRTRT